MTSGSARRKYKRPPITEAIVEFRLKPSSEWDPTFPGRFQMQPVIAGFYTGKPRTQRVREVLIQESPGKHPKIATQDSPERVILPDATGQRLVILGPNSLSINDLAPYSGWEAYRPRIEQAIEAFETMAGPMEVSRVGLRYINHVGIPTRPAPMDAIELGDYFLCAPPVIAGLPRDHRDFTFQCEYVYPDECSLRLQHGIVGSSMERLTLLLDLDMGWNAGESLVTSETALSLVELLHEREGTAFEALITDKARELFDVD